RVARRRWIHRLIESRFHWNDRERWLFGRHLLVERNSSPPLVECDDRIRFVQLRRDEYVAFARPGFTMLRHRHVELERTNRGKRAENLPLSTAALRNHFFEERTTVLRAQVRRELQLVLLERSGAHVALE